MTATARHITAEDFEDKVLARDVPTLIDFYRPLCHGCRQLIPIIDELALLFSQGKSKVQAYQCNDEKLMQRYRVFFVPQLVLFAHGTEFWIERKINTREGVQEEIDRLLRRV